MLICNPSVLIFICYKFTSRAKNSVRRYKVQYSIVPVNNGDAKEYSGQFQTSMIDIFVKIINGVQPSIKVPQQILTLCVPWTYIYVRMCRYQQPRYVCFSNHRRIYTSRICFASNHTVLLAATKDVYIRHTYVLPATKDVYICFEYGYFLLSVVVLVDSFGRWYVVFSILHKKISVLK